MLLLDFMPNRDVIQRWKRNLYWTLGVLAWLIMSILIFGEPSQTS